MGAAAAVGLTTKAAWAGTAPVYSDDGVAVDGSDVVAYFTDGAPIKGSAEFTHYWNGATWQFVSAANRDAFAADPAAYAPQYGGYCAYAVSEGYTAPTSPDAWRIVDGKLYLNFNRRIQRRWERDIPGRITSADANWPRVLD
ncbi:MAG: YHS domain-containing (seleno)protein [Pseudomonadota bacterium]